MRTRDLLQLKNTGHPGINALFAKAHSADWDFEQDVGEFGTRRASPRSVRVLVLDQERYTPSNRRIQIGRCHRGGRRRFGGRFEGIVGTGSSGDCEQCNNNNAQAAH